MILIVTKKSIANVGYVTNFTIKHKSQELCSTVEKMTASILYVCRSTEKKSLLL